MVYLDTSVLLPYYRPEAISDAVQAFLGSLAEPVSTSWRTELEVSAALARWVRMGECTEEEAAAAEALFDEDLEAQLYRRLALEPQHFL
jgi:predicted nucleic acid-binding protein